MRRRIAIFLTLATASWLIAGIMDLKTEIEVTVWNGLVEWTVENTTITVRTEIANVDSIEIIAQDGLHPIGGSTLEATTLEGHVSHRRLPSRFSFSSNKSSVVGDWWVDEAAEVSTVFSTAADLGSEFTVRGVFTGRHHQYLGLKLSGTPGVMCAFRRGLINNDLQIFDGEGNILVSGSLDPVPLERLGSLMATILRAVAGGSVLLALWSGIAGFGGKQKTSIPDLDPRVFATGVILLSVVGAGLAAWIAVEIFDGLPHLPDEVVYQLQGRWLLSGQLTGPEPLCSEHFMIPLTYFQGGRWIGHYPPAWPLFLAPGIWFGIPWLAPTLLRIPHIILVALLGLRLGGRWTALASASAALVSPLALLLFGSRMPHAGSATCLLAAILLCLPRGPRTSPWRWMGAGITFGLAFGMRPLTAVSVAIPIGLFLVIETWAGRRRWRDSVLLILAGLATSVPTLIANSVLTGSPWSFPYSLAEGSMYSIRHLAFGIRNVDAMIAYLVPVVHGWGWPWLTWPVSLALPFAFVAALFLSHHSTREDRLLAAIAAAVVMVHLGTRATGLHGFGPRYLFVPCCITWVLTVRGAGILAAKEKRSWPVAGAIVALLILSAAIAIPDRISLFRQYNHVTDNLVQAASTLPECSLVLFPGDNWRGWAESAPWLGTPGENPTTIFAADLGETIGLEWCFPDHRLFRLTEGHLVPVVAFDEDDEIP